ncbi:MAG: hypothetical protein ACRDPR_15160, partial [Nocardioidaceae bacterium]
MSDDLLFSGVAMLAGATSSGELSSRELVEACLARVDEVDGTLRAFSSVLRESALAEAGERDAARARGERP